MTEQEALARAVLAELVWRGKDRPDSILISQGVSVLELQTAKNPASSLLCAINGCIRKLARHIDEELAWPRDITTFAVSEPTATKFWIRVIAVPFPAEARCLGSEEFLEKWAERAKRSVQVQVLADKAAAARNEEL